jgi:hypothetical protein
MISNDELDERLAGSGNPAWIELLAPCGLYCGVCPQYIATPQKCGGCNSGQGLARRERALCGINKCCRNQGLSRCNECDRFESCGTLSDFSTWDSFISHAPVRANLEQLSAKGEENWMKSMAAAILGGSYPPVPRKGTVSARHLLKLMRSPVAAKKNKKPST